jgi:hypothetical protein
MALADVFNIKTLTSFLTGRVPDQVGTFGYKAGTNGTVALTGSKKVHGVGVVAITAGTVTINGGETITIPAKSAWSWDFKGNLTDPTFIFTGTAAYFIEYLV